MYKIALKNFFKLTKGIILFFQIRQRGTLVRRCLARIAADCRFAVISANGCNIPPSLTCAQLYTIDRPNVRF